MAVAIETRAGEPVYAAGIKIVPFARALRWRHSLLPFGIIWNRAAAVLAIYPDGREQVLPVHDETRRLQVMIFGIAALWAILSLMIRRPTFSKGQ
jgi:hypothetical protein